MTSTELREWMTAGGWSVRRLARALDLEPSTVQRWRSGTHPIPKIAQLALQAL